MKITFFINTLSSGGAEHQLTLLANMLDDKGYDVEIATYGDIPDHYKVNNDIKRICLGVGKSRLCKIIGIFNFFRSNKTDVIISFCQQNNLISGLSLILGLVRTKFIVSERNFTIGKSYWGEKILFKLIYRRASAIVPNSFSQSNYIQLKAPWLKKKLKPIINFTDLNVFKPIANNCNDKAIRFCVMARFEEQKNYKRFAYAIAILKEQGLNFKVDWYGSQFIGSEFRKGYIELKKLIEELGIEDTFQLYDSKQNIQQLLTQYDFFCLPSLYEGFSNAISEAICCGIPAVVSDVSDNSLMVKNGLNGYVCDPLDVGDIAVKLSKMIRLTDDERKQMGIESRRIAENLFNKNNFIQSYINIIEK